VSDDPDLVAWFDDLEPVGLGTDTLANELPYSTRSGDAYPMHRLLMRNRGISFHEALWLEDLSADCASDGCYEGVYIASPLKLAGASGSPVNPMFAK
jgi:kynurenine formamidase